MVGERGRWGVRGLEGAVRTLGGHVCQKVAEDVGDTGQVVHRDHGLTLLSQAHSAQTLFLHTLASPRGGGSHAQLWIDVEGSDQV